MRILMAGTGDGHGEGNFARTVRSPVDLEEYASDLSFTQRQLLSATHGRYARVWGFDPSANIARELKVGDQVWFHRSGYVSDIAEVVTIFTSPKFDQALWGDWDGRDHGPGFIMTLTEPRPAHIAKSYLNDQLGYGPGYTWRRNILLSEEVSEILASALRLVLV